MKVLVAFLLLMGFAFQANSMMPPSQSGDNQNSKGKDNYNKSNCPPSNAKLLMQFNDVKALVEVGGSMWQNRQINAASYEVPKGGGNHVLYSGAIWMGGLDVNNQLKLAAIQYRKGEDFWAGPLSVSIGTGDYDPSQPVGDDATKDFGAATIDPDVCIQYDKFFTIKKSEVVNFTRAFECNQDPNCTDVFPISNDAIQRIYNWPAHGDVSRGQDYYLAPFYDYPVGNTGEGDGVYNPDDGDIPWFDDILNRDDVKCGFDRRVTLFGDITHWWVFNDKGNIHTETNADPIGMEIRAQAFSFATNDEVNQMTFYNYQMINRSTQTLQNTYFGQYADPDVGFSEDDYVGCDVSRGLGFAYNGVSHDPGQSGAPGYGDNPPAIGIDFFQGPYQDADGIDNPGPHDGYVPTVLDAIDSLGIVYSGIGIGYSDGIIDNERYGMRIFDYWDRPDYAISSGITDDPKNPGDYYNYMTGHWKDNSPFYYGGKAYTGTSGVTNTETSYVYPGESDPYHWATKGQDMGFDWSESNIDGANSTNDPGDRRFFESAGPFTLRPGAINNLTVGVVFGQSFTGNAYESVNVMKKNDTKAQALFDNCFKIMDPPQAPNLSIVELTNKLVLVLDNPYGNNVNESYDEEDKINIQDPINGPPYDKHYKFEGYQIFQLSGSDAGISDITAQNKDKARLVAQCDLKNSVSKLVNWDYNEALGYSIPHEMVDGNNKGIQHSFELTTDAFTGKTLVNHKTYYYIAIAYAYNNYKTYNPKDPQALDGQQHRYISSRLSADGGAIHSVTGIPHNPQPRFGGTYVQLPYGSSPQITTLDGRGNGGMNLDLTPESEDYIVAHGSIETPTYQVGRGPVNIKVVNPLNVLGGYYQLSLTNTKVNTTSDALPVIDSAGWVLKRYDKKGGQLLGTVTSERSFSSENEQIIPEWGISVDMYKNPYPCIVSDSSCQFRGRVALPIESTLTYGDSSKRWLSGVQNVSSYDPRNWIMSGASQPTADQDDPSLGYNNPSCYKIFTVNDIYADQNKVYTQLLNGTITLGLLARRNTCGYTPIALDPSYFGGIQEYCMSSVYQPSVDIVFTSDKSKWTRCPVIEMGHDPSLNVNGAIPGQLRKSPSVDKNGNQLGDPGYNAAEADPNGTTPYGMGWFPGYAVDVESGRRLNMAFGENSFLVGQNGADMKWDPTQSEFQNGLPVMGGQHVIYVFGRVGTSNNMQILTGDVPNYDEGQTLYNLLKTASYSSLQNAYARLSWVVNPLLAPGQRLLATDAKIRVRINQEYSIYNKTGDFAGVPTYEWNMSRYETVKDSKKALASALDMINVVPNPYYAFSEYEQGRLDTRVKITNLPEKCKVTIYNTSGKLIRAYDKDSPITSIDWDLKNSQKIPVAGGVYLIHVDVPDVGQRVIKFFGGMRQPDLENL